VAPGLEIQSFLEQSGSFTNIGSEEKSIPVGPKGDRCAEMVSCQSLYTMICYLVISLAAALYTNVIIYREYESCEISIVD